jgi:hypothetical protein
MFRTAAFLCYAFATLVYTLVTVLRGTLAYAALQQLASLGVAVWVVAVLLAVVAATQRLAAAR